MPLVKRYPNRKLYDTGAKRYVTLDDVAAMVRDGQDVQVIDHETGDDLTEVTLARVVFTETRRKAALLPRAMLAQLIRAGGTPTPSWQRQLRLAFQTLVEEGELTESGAQRLRDLVEQSSSADSRWTGLAERHLQRAIQRLNLPSQNDLELLKDQLEQLAARLEALKATPPVNSTRE
jgi:polyhydroxyalkanoate synthesis repressor PhaR